MSKKTEKVRRFLSKDASIRVSSVVAPELLLEVQKISGLSPLAAIAVGRASLACVLMASHHKEDRVSLHFDGSGPLGRLFVEASFDGNMRAYVTNPYVDLPPVNGKLDVSGAVGHGLLNVTHTSGLNKSPYRGTVIIKTGEIGSDVAFYLQQSHQIPSIVSLGVHLDKDGLIDAAGGVLIELMPGHDEALIEKLEKNLEGAKAISDMLLEGLDEKELVSAYMGDIAFEEIEHPYNLNYSCTCSEERLKNSLILLGEEELGHLLKTKEATEIRCDFCGKKYYLANQEIEVLQEQSRKKSMH